MTGNTPQPTRKPAHRGSYHPCIPVCIGVGAVCRAHGRPWRASASTLLHFGSHFDPHEGTQQGPNRSFEKWRVRNHPSGQDRRRSHVHRDRACGYRVRDRQVSGHSPRHQQQKTNRKRHSPHIRRQRIGATCPEKTSSVTEDRRRTLGLPGPSIGPGRPLAPSCLYKFNVRVRHNKAKGDQGPHLEADGPGGMALSPDCVVRRCGCEGRGSRTSAAGSSSRRSTVTGPVVRRKTG